MAYCTYPTAPQERDMSSTASVSNSLNCCKIEPLWLAGVFPSTWRHVNPACASADEARSKVDVQNENTMLGRDLLA